LGFGQCALEDLVMTAKILEFYRGKTVFVTGHTGFKGAWLSEWLLSAGARVVGYALPPATEPALFRALSLESRMKSLFADVRDGDMLSRVLREHEPEVVFHLAAQAIVRLSYCEPLETFQTNVMGTAHVLNAMRSVPSVKSTVIVTSDKCYENVGTRKGYVETDAMGGHDPYSASKGAAELVTAAFRRSFFANDDRRGVASARAGNVIGGGDWSVDRLVPDIVRGTTDRRAIVIRNPASVRPWQHVLDPLFGYLTLAHAIWHDPGQFSQGYNFGPDHAELSVGELARRVVERLGRGTLETPKSSGNEPHEAALLTLDSNKAKRELAWAPRLDIDETVAFTAEWYRAFAEDPANARATTAAQIASYERKLPGSGS
jgi:CDP-glucose 4,6-dehydratase